jgi:hypothetical protein
MARTCGQSSKPGSTALTSTINTVSSANEKLRAQCDIAELITAYREGASAARLVAAHGVGLASVQRFRASLVSAVGHARRSMNATPGAMHP